jgi:gas vesicle protein GvpO
MARQATQKPDEDTGGTTVANGSRRPLRQLVRTAAEQLGELTGCEVCAVSGVEQTNDGWRVDIDIVELRRVPDTTSVLATYALDLDDDGELRGYRRVRRFNRASTEDE